MNEYHYSDCDIGMTESFRVEITDAMMTSFHNLSEDENPMHMNQVYAQKYGFKDR